MLFEIRVDFVFGVIPVFIEGGLCILIAVYEVIKLFFVSLVHLIENSIFMFFLECLYFESAFLSVIILAIDFVCLHYFVLILKLLLYLLNCPLHVNKIMISKQHNIQKMKHISTISHISFTIYSRKNKIYLFQALKMIIYQVGIENKSK